MWFGLGIMVAMIVGLVVWCIWAYRRDTAAQSQSINEQGPREG